MRIRDMPMYKHLASKPWNKGKSKEIQRSLDLVKNNRGKAYRFSEQAKTILTGFSWCETHQGSAYWCDLYFGHEN